RLVAAASRLGSLAPLLAGKATRLLHVGPVGLRGGLDLRLLVPRQAQMIDPCLREHRGAAAAPPSTLPLRRGSDRQRQGQSRGNQDGRESLRHTHLVVPPRWSGAPLPFRCERTRSPFVGWPTEDREPRAYTPLDDRAMTGF